ALIHGEHALECQCRRGERCPHDGAADRPDPRRGPLVQILLDAETLLGLRQNPAVLADGTPLDPELARLIATDAHWQGLLTELHDVLTARAPHTHQPSHTQTETEAEDAENTEAAEDAETPGDAGTHVDADTGTPGDTGLGDTETEDEAIEDEAIEDEAGTETTVSGTAAVDENTDSPDDLESDDTGAAATDRRQVPRKMLSSLRIRVPRLIHRGRIRRAGTVPTPTRTPTSGTGLPSATGLLSGTGLLSDTLRAQITAALLAAITADPALAAGPHPDGHGGVTEPPPGALTYRPNTDLAARVRMTYRTCTHPGCTVPSTDCELDHIVPYDHHTPHRGGWTIETNL
ncbi:HNH endonuclease, partial [Rhodococcus sp. 14-2686-1-2]